jgi:hypothetical protein
MTGGSISWNKTATIGALLLYKRLRATWVEICLRARRSKMEVGTAILTAMNQV